MLRRRRQQQAVVPATVDTSDVVALGVAPTRERIRVQGQVMRMRARPAQGLPTLVVLIADDTGRATVHWTGRRAIGGIALGRKLIVDGVATRSSEGLTFTNPRYTLLP